VKIKNKKIFSYLIVIFIVTIALYSDAINNNYNMDDDLVLNQNYPTDTNNLSSVFTEHSYKSDNYNFAYRPLSILSFYIENAIFGKSPHISHLINIILYAILNIIVFIVLYKLSDNFFTSISITILFIIFPLHTEVVDSIKNRDELFVSIFGFLTLYFTLRSLKKSNPINYIPIFLCSLIGILFKESFLIFLPIIVITVLIIKQKSNLKQKIIYFFKYLFIISGAILIKKIMTHYFLHTPISIREFEFFENPLFFTSFFNRILPAIYIIGKYILLLLFPFKLSYYYGYNTILYNHYLSIEFLLGIISILVTLLLILKFIFLKNEIKNQLMFIGIILLMINLISISNLFEVLPGIVAERFIFNGSLGYCILAFFLLQYLINSITYLKLKEGSKNRFFLSTHPHPLSKRGSKMLIFTTFLKKEILLACLIIFSLPLCIKTISRNKIWKDEFTLYSHDIKNVPNSVKANEMLAENYLNKYYKNNNPSLLNSSEFYYLKIYQLTPKYAPCLNNLGTINFIKKDYNKAIDFYKETLKIKDKTITHFNLAESYKNVGNINLAKKEYEYVLLNNAKIPNIYSHYKQFIIQNNLTNLGIKFIEERLLKTSQNINNYLLLIDLYNEKKEYASMLKYLEIANKIQPKKEYQIYINKLKLFLSKK